MHIQQADTALIVDDDPIARAIYQAFLANFGFGTVHEAASGQQAVTTLATLQGALDLLILDLNMPEMDGIEILKHLHEINYGGRLVIGSASHQANRQSALKLAELYGLDLIGFIAKPLTKGKLEEVFLAADAGAQPRLVG